MACEAAEDASGGSRREDQYHFGCYEVGPIVEKDANTLNQLNSEDWPAVVV
jgi:hypothetical protein